MNAGIASILNNYDAVYKNMVSQLQSSGVGVNGISNHADVIDKYRIAFGEDSNYKSITRLTYLLSQCPIMVD